jgi:hypothetical protein
MALRGLCFVCFLVPALAAAQEVPFDQTIPLTGSAALYREVCPNGPASDDCVMTIFIDGEVAKMLYNGMHAEAMREECTGGTQKYDETGLNCIMDDDGTAWCEFGYHFGERRFGWGGLGC